MAYKALIDVVEWSPQDHSEYAYKFPHTNLSTGTQLIVRESQEAVFFSKGEILGKFGPGSHTLSTENIPLLRNLFGIPFGGKNPFFAEVWFVNKTTSLTNNWITTTMRIRDPEYNSMLPIVAKGRYGVRVVDAERFLVKLVGSMQRFTAQDLNNHFAGPLITRVNSSIISYMTANGIGINSIASYLVDLSNFIKQPISEFWEEYGFVVDDFSIVEVNLDMSTAEGKKISEAMSDRTAQEIAGYTWQQKQSFEVAGKNGNAGMGILGVAMMTGAMGTSGMNPMMQPPVAGQYQAPQNQPYGMGNNQPHVRREVFCSKCSKKFPTTSSFCPFCGNKYNPCPACGADNSQSATRCLSCGTMLANMNTGNNFCPRCNNTIQPGTLFCPNCGNKIS